MFPFEVKGYLGTENASTPDREAFSSFQYPAPFFFLKSSTKTAFVSPGMEEKSLFFFLFQAAESLFFFPPKSLRFTPYFLGRHIAIL